MTGRVDGVDRLVKRAVALTMLLDVLVLLWLAACHAGAISADSAAMATAQKRGRPVAACCVDPMLILALWCAGGDG